MAIMALFQLPESTTDERRTAAGRTERDMPLPLTDPTTAKFRSWQSLYYEVGAPGGAFLGCEGMTEDPLDHPKTRSTLARTLDLRRLVALKNCEAVTMARSMSSKPYGDTFASNVSQRPCVHLTFRELRSDLLERRSSAS
jgi:hypothetical protein